MWGVYSLLGYRNQWDECQTECYPANYMYKGEKTTFIFWTACFNTGWFTETAEVWIKK